MATASSETMAASLRITRRSAIGNLHRHRLDRLPGRGGVHLADSDVARGGKWRRGRDNFRPRAGAGNNLWPHAQETLFIISGSFSTTREAAVVIADVPSPLAEHHRPSRSDSMRARTICVGPVGAPDRDPFSICGPMQMDQDKRFGSPVCVGPLEMPLDRSLVLDL
jgi:hypothetical protein